MNISAVSSTEQGLRRNLFIKYANSFMAAPNDGAAQSEEPKLIQNDKKTDKTMGIETLTIFPKEVINGKTTIIA